MNYSENVSSTHPTLDELREVGLRPCVSTYKLRVRYRANERYGRIVGVEEYVVSVPTVGQRTLGEYWRRRRMLNRERKFHEIMSDLGHPLLSNEDIHAVALSECRTRCWAAWPKSGWKR